MVAATPTGPGATLAWMSIEEVIAYLGPRREGKPVHRVTVTNWMNVGLGGIRLRSVKRGGNKSFTTAEWLEAFFEQVTAAKERLRQELRRRAPPAPGKLQKRYAKTAERLRATGVL